MSQTPTPGFIERFENCDLKDFKKEDLDMITREMNILYSKLRELVIYNATSLEIFLTYLRQGNLQLAELFRKRALFELLTIEEDRNDIMLMEEQDLEQGLADMNTLSSMFDPTSVASCGNEIYDGSSMCECVVQYSKYYFDPEEKEQGPTLLEEKSRQNPEKINVEEKSKPTKRLKDNTEVAGNYFDPEFEMRRKMYRRKSLRSIKRKITPDESISDQRSVIKEQRLSPEGGYSTKKDRNGDKSPESRHQNIKVKDTSDHKSSPLLSSNTDPKHVVQELVNNLKPSSADKRNGSAQPLKEITDNLGSTRPHGVVGGSISPDKTADNLNSVSNVINEKNNNLVKDRTKAEQVLDEERNKRTNTRNPLKQNTDILSDKTINILQESQRKLDHDEYIHMKDEENDDKMKQPGDFIDLTTLMGPDMSSRTSHSSSPEQKEFDEVSASSPIMLWHEVDSSGRDLLMSDDQKTTTNSKRERVDDKTSDDNNDNMVIQKREINTKSPNMSIEASRSPRTTIQDNEGTITQKDTYETNTLKLTAELEDTTKEIIEKQENIDHSSTSLQGNINFEILTKPSMIPVGNAASSDNILGLDRSTMNSEQISEANIDNTNFMNTERSTRDVTFNGRRDNTDGVNISTGGLNEAEQEKRTDSSMSIWQDNKSNADEPKVKYISSKNKFPKDARDFDYKDENSINAMNNGESMTPDSIRKGTVESEAQEIDARESASGSMLVSKDQNHDEKVTRVVNDQKSERSFHDTNRTDQTHGLEIRSFHDTNRTDQTHVLEIRSDVEKEKLLTVNQKNNGNKTPITRRLSIGSLGTLSPIREGEQITDETDLKVSTESLSQPYLQETTKINNRMEKGDDGTDEMKVSLNEDSAAGTLDGSKSQSIINIDERKYQDSNITSKEIDSKSQIGDAVNATDHLKQNVDSDNLTSTSEGEKDKVSTDSNKTKQLVDAETCIQQEGTPSDDSASNGLKVINIAVSTDSQEMLTDNSLEMRVSSLSSQLSEERGDSDSLGQERITMPMKEETHPDVDKPQETQAENKNSSQHAVASKETSGLQSNSLDMTSENSVTVKSNDDIDSVQNENSKHPKGHVSDEGKVMQTYQGERSSRERSVSPQNGDLAQIGKDSTRTETPKYQEVDPGLKQTSRTNNGESDPFQEGEDPSSTKYAENRINTDEKTDDKKKAKTVLKRVNEKMKNVYQHEEMLRRSEEASLLLKQGNPNIADLSDNSRPTNLAERFSELYDNEYTDAFEELQKINFDERKIAHVLLCIVKHAYYFCSERASDERNHLMSVMKNVPAATSNGNPLKTEALRKGIVAQSLKDNAPSLFTRIGKEFFESRYQSLIPEGIDSQNHRLLKYVQVCVEIVWWMCVQDPPIYLSWIEETERREFDKDEYRSYTKSGKTVDFCVWPLVHLCKGGPILAKGIAQGK